MYNTLFGVNNLALICLEAIELKPEDIHRFRDAIFYTEDNKHFVKILTRTGGSNRESFDCSKMIKNKFYLKDYDDSYDNTYRYFIYKIADNLEAIIDWEGIFKDQSRNKIDIKEMFEKEMHGMKIPGTDANKRSKAMANGLMKLLNSNKEITAVSPEDLIKLGTEEDE